MKIIYWNSKKHTEFLTIKEILTEENPDILFLSETDDSIIKYNSSQLNLDGYEHLENPGCSRIVIVKKTSINLSLSKQDYYYSALKHIDTDVIIISVHLPSQMYQHIDALKSNIRMFREEVDAEFGSSLNKKILIIGDFNVNPFEKPMIDFDGFAASNSKNLKKEVSHLKSKKALYYNPTWTLYSKNNFPGTIYFKRPSGASFDILEHHFLDQVVISYFMNQSINFESVSVLEKTSKNVFFDDKKNKIQLSDHLPLVYEYQI